MVTILHRYMPSHATVARIGDNSVIHVDLDDYIQREIYFFGRYESKTSEVLKTLLRPGDTVLDVGANVGYFSLLFAEQVGPNGQVIAFEPAQNTYRQLRSNAELNERANIKTIRTAIGAESGEATIFLSGPENSGTASRFQQPLTTDTVETVDLTTLDQVMIDHGIETVRLVKIDVEGAEGDVLKGMNTLLNSPSRPYICCEIAPELLEKSNYSSNELHQYILAFGYTAISISEYDAKPAGDCLPNEIVNVLYTPVDL